MANGPPLRSCPLVEPATAHTIGTVDGLHDSEPGRLGIAFQGKEREMGGGVNGDGVGFVGEVGFAELVKARRGP